MTAPFDLIAFDPGNESHAAFVYDTFRKSTDHWPWSEMPRGRLMDRLKRELATPGTETALAVPQQGGDSFLGWYSVRRPDTVVFAFTRYSARTKPAMRVKLRVGETALRSMGVDIRTQEHVWVVFWTGIAARIAERFPLVFDTRDAYDEERRG